jgi:hypothetical protein
MSINHLIILFFYFIIYYFIMKLLLSHMYKYINFIFNADVVLYLSFQSKMSMQLYCMHVVL